MRPGLRIALIVLVVGLLSAATAGKAAEPDRQKIQAAIQKASDYLVQLYKPGSEFPGETLQLGYACLAGMALLESGVDEKTPALQNIAKLVRARCLQETGTYQISLCILFLDRLGDPADRPFIQFLGARLLFGQKESGGWFYQCGSRLTLEEEVNLRALFKIPLKNAKGSSRPDEVGGDSTKTKKASEMPGQEVSNPAKPALHPEVGKLINQFQAAANRGGNDKATPRSDNSNTQFAMLGLWCARRHGVPIEKSMNLVEKRFRTSQLANGGWSYEDSKTSLGSMLGATPTMTCVGLIGLAVSFGATDPAQKETRAALLEDDVVKAGFNFVGETLRRQREIPEPKGQKAQSEFRPGDLRTNLYFLWTLERLGVIYGMEKIGDVDWYAWGVEYLLKTQTAEGSWNSNFPSSAPALNASLGILFLARANVAKDLTGYLANKRGSGESTLKGGGSGTPAVQKNHSGSTIAPDPKPSKADSDSDKQAARLAESVINASGMQRTEIINTLRDSKGSVYTDALKLSAGKLTGAPQTQVREALARRLTRMTGTTLREMLAEDHRELRLAVVTALGLKADKQYVPELIACLTDKDVLVSQAAHAALVNLTGKDFGPDPKANDADRTRALLAWLTWWKTQKN